MPLLWLSSSSLLGQTDPGDPGPNDVTRVEYNFGDTAFTPPALGVAVEVIASVHYPTDLPAGPYPLILFLHGRHATCYQGTTAFLQWPCSVGRTPIPSYQGYDHIASLMASNGYIVVSIGANGINAVDNNYADLGMLARAQLAQHHLGRWNTWNTTGGAPFGTTFVGKVNLGAVGTMGHSRGGEGVARHYVLNADLGSPYTIKAVLPLAPVNFDRPLVNDVPLDVVLCYCDGDVSDLQGVHYFDDARYVLGDQSAKYTMVIMGGNHNFFNVIWTPGEFPAGTFEDWADIVPGGTSDPHCGTVAGNRRLTAAQQRAAGRAYVVGFFRLHVGGETTFAPLFKGDTAPPSSSQLATGDIFVSYHPPDSPTARRDVNRLLTGVNLTTNTLGGSVTQSGLNPYNLCGGPIPQPGQCLPSSQSTARQPHTVPSARSSARGLSQLRFGWDDLNATYQNDLPVGSRDVTGFPVLQFRAAVNFADTRNAAGVSKDFTVTLTDGAGNTATRRISDASGALFYPPGSTSVTPLPKILLNAIRMKLSDFTGYDQLDRADVRSIRFSFDQQDTGAVLMTDLRFAD